MALPTKPSNTGGRNYTHTFPSCASIRLHLKRGEKHDPGTISIYRKNEETEVLSAPSDLDFVVLDELNQISSMNSYSSYFRSSKPDMKIRFYAEGADKIEGTYKELKENPVVKQAKGKFKVVVFGILNGKELAQMEVGGLLFTNKNTRDLPKGWFDIQPTASPENSRLCITDFVPHKLKFDGIPEATYYLPIWEWGGEDVLQFLHEDETRLQLAALLDAAISERLGEPMNTALAPVQVNITTPTHEESPVFEQETPFLPAEDLPF